MTAENVALAYAGELDTSVELWGLPSKMAAIRDRRIS